MPWRRRAGAVLRSRTSAWPRQGRWRLVAACARSNRLPSLEPAMHVEHSCRDCDAYHALPHPDQGAASRSCAARRRMIVPARRRGTGTAGSFLFGRVVDDTVNDVGRLFRARPAASPSSLALIAPALIPVISGGWRTSPTPNSVTLDPPCRADRPLREDRCPDPWQLRVAADHARGMRSAQIRSAITHREPRAGARPRSQPDDRPRAGRANGRRSPAAPCRAGRGSGRIGRPVPLRLEA